MKPTRGGTLVTVLVAATVITAGLLRAWYGSLPPLPVGPVLSVLLVAVFEGLLAESTRSRLQARGKVRPPEPIAMARYAALARASSLVGAGVTGAWLGALLFLSGQRGSVLAVSHDRHLAPFGLVSGLALVGAALWLEWVCRIRRPPGQQGQSDRRDVA